MIHESACSPVVAYCRDCGKEVEKTSSLCPHCATRGATPTANIHDSVIGGDFIQNDTEAIEDAVVRGIERFIPSLRELLEGPETQDELKEAQTSDKETSSPPHLFEFKPNPSEEFSLGYDAFVADDIETARTHWQYARLAYMYQLVPISLRLNDACRLQKKLEWEQCVEFLDCMTGLTRTLNYLGEIARINENLDEAESLARDSLETSQYFGVPALRESVPNRDPFRSAEAESLNILGLIATDRGDFVEAARLFMDSNKISLEIDNPAFQALVLRNVSNLVGKGGEAEVVAELGRRAGELRARMEHDD